MENRQDTLNNTQLLAAVERMEREQSRESREVVSLEKGVFFGIVSSHNHPLGFWVSPDK